MSQQDKNFCCRCRFDFWDDTLVISETERGKYICLASATVCKGGETMYSTSCSMKISEGAFCSKFKAKRKFLKNPKPRRPYKVSVLGLGILRSEVRDG